MGDLHTNQEHNMETDLEISTPQLLSREYPVTIKYQRRTSKFFSLTDAEIEMYASWGWASTILLTLFGAFIGFSLGCAVALMQGNLTPVSQAMLTSAAVVSAVPAIVFLVLAVAATLYQRKLKNQWETTPGTTHIGKPSGNNNIAQPLAQKGIQDATQS
jgi:ABC-type amino acid transport system permease subunit